MHHTLIRRFAVTCLSVALACATTSQSKAGPISNWLFGPRTVYSNPNAVAPFGVQTAYYGNGPVTIYPPATPPFPSGPRYYMAPQAAPTVGGQTSFYPPATVVPQGTTVLPGQTSYYGNPQTLPAVSGQTVYYGNAPTLPAMGGQTVYYGNPQTLPAVSGQTAYYGNPQTLPATGGQTVYYGNAQTLPPTGGQTVYYGNAQTLPATGGQTVYYGNSQTLPAAGGRTMYYGGGQALPAVGGQVPYSYPVARPVFPWLYRLRNSIGNWSPLRPFGRPTTVGYPYTAAYPPVTAYRPVIAYPQTAPVVAGRTVYSNPQAMQVYGGGGAEFGDPCAVPVYQQPVMQYMPSTGYRTRLLKVPVTYYRPVSTIDPATGVPVTYMAPCTSNTWQVRRVPYTTYSPVVSSVAVVGASACPTMQPIDCGACPTSMPATTNPASEPYYNPPSNYVPGSSAPLGTQPDSGYGSEPADFPPNLNSNVLRVTPQAMSRGGAPQESEDAESVRDGKFGASIRASAPETDAAADANSSNANANGYDRLRIRLVPDPETPPIPTRRDSGPQPNSESRHKTAYQPMRLATGFVPVSWPAADVASITVDASSQKIDTRAIDMVAPSSTPDADRWDDTGWRSLNAR